MPLPSLTNIGKFAVFCPSTFTCPYCEKSKDLMRSKGFNENNGKLIITKTENLEKLKLPDGSIITPPDNDNYFSYPQIYYQPTSGLKFQYIGGLDKLQKVLRA
jgi:hypothetical protein